MRSRDRAGCGDDADDDARNTATSQTATATRSSPPAPTSRFDTATVPGLTTSPQETYEQAKVACGLKHARDVAADFNLTTTNREAIARRFAVDHQDPLKRPAEVGCSDGLEEYADEHPRQRPKRPDPAELAQRFYLRVDDDAVKLQDAIAAAQDDQSSARATIVRLRDRIRSAAVTYRRQTGKQSAGARRLVSVADRAVAAIDARDPRRLVAARVASFDARDQLAEDVTDD